MTRSATKLRPSQGGRMWTKPVAGLCKTPCDPNYGRQEKLYPAEPVGYRFNVLRWGNG